jgi:DNA-binding transcriptional regulator WhiA
MTQKRISASKKLRAYIIGVALGDGNLSNPNGRAIRLRITCDGRYPHLAEHIRTSIQELLPDNAVVFVRRTKNYFDISCYSNYWEEILGWRAGKGSKIAQSVSVPEWIKNNRSYTRHCLCGLLQTDGSFYIDRGYSMINFTNSCERLAMDVKEMMASLDYHPNLQKLHYANGRIKYTIRVSRNARQFVRTVSFWKS